MIEESKSRFKQRGKGKAKRSGFGGKAPWVETELGNSYKTVLIQPGNSKESAHGTCADSFKVYPLRWRCGEGCDEAQQMYINQLQTMPSL